MPALHLRWVLPLTVVAFLPACTSDADPEQAETAAAADEAAVTYVGAVEELDLTIPEALVMSDEATLVVQALDHVGSQAVAIGNLADGGQPLVPGIFIADAASPTGWQQGEVLLPDGYVSGTGGAADAPGVVVASHLDHDRQRHVSLWTKDSDPKQIALIDTHNPVTVNNVFENGDDLVAVGQIIVESDRVPAAWIIDSDGRVDHIDVSGLADRGYLSAGVVHDDVVHLFGVDLTTDEPLYARGGVSPNAAEPTEMPTPLTDAHRIRTAVSTGNAIWLGGAIPGGASGHQALWSFDGDDSGREISRTLWDDRPFTSSISRLVVDPSAWEEGDMVQAVDAGQTWWVITTGREIQRSGYLGGRIAAYTPGHDWRLTYEPRTAEFAFDGEPIDADIPTTPAQAGVAHPRQFTGGFTLIGTGWRDPQLDLVRDGESVVALEGAGNLRAIGDLLVAFGEVSPDDQSGPMLAVIEDDDATPADLDVDEDANTTRLRALVDRGGDGPAVYGHQWLDNDLHFYGVEYVDGDWEPIDRPEGLDEGRAVGHDCGTRAFITYSEDGEQGIGVADGAAVIDMLMPDGLNAQVGMGCADDTADGTVYFAAEDDLARFDPATGDIDLVTPDEDVETFHGIEVVHDGKTVVAIGSLYESPGLVSAWAAPVDQPGEWQQLEAVDTPVGMHSLRLLGINDDNIIIGGMYGNEARAWAVSIEQG